VIAQLQDMVIVMAGIQERQANVQKGQAEWLEQLQAGWDQHEKRMAHVEQNLAEITDKLNALIGYIDGMQRDKPQ
jgi:hypothetical protein